MIETRIAGPELLTQRTARSGRRTQELVLTVEGRLDIAAAARTAATARPTARKARVTIDLRRVPVDDVGLAVLAREMAGHPVAILGLTRHHKRLLRNLEGDLDAHRGVEDG